MLTRSDVINIQQCAEARAIEAEEKGCYNQATREWDTALQYVYRSATIRRRSLDLLKQGWI